MHLLKECIVLLKDNFNYSFFLNSSNFGFFEAT